MIELKKDVRLVYPLTWDWVLMGGVRHPKVVCKCGEKIALNKYAISVAGIVYPEFNHSDSVFCGFRDEIKLLSYPPEGRILDENRKGRQWVLP